MGAAVDGLADFDHDYEMDFVIASPGFDFFAADTGLVRVYSGASFAPMWMTFGAAGDRMGTSVDIAPDLNGDGYVELAVAAPFRDAGANDGGSVMVYTGTSIHSGGPATVLHELRSGITQAHMGQSVQIVLDVNGDGTSDVLCGAPDYDSPFGGADHGAVWIYSGATGARLGWLIGAANQRLGATLGGGDEFDGNGFNDFVCDGNVSASLFPALGWTYCTGKTNSHGCVPAVSTLGQASATSSAAFYVRGSQFLNQHSGHLFYGFAPAQAPFPGGFKCVASPTHRTPSQSSGGTAAPAVDCSGQYAVDFKALIQSHVDPVLVAGREVFCQYYARDPQSVAGSSLSNATNFVIGP
jgi:hypothetical protein